MAKQMTYEQTMAWGAAQWSDVTDTITRAGFGRAEFTQTGGMCAAIVVGLEDGYHLLVTDADDTLSWERDRHRGWYVGLYVPDEIPGEPLAYLKNDAGDTGTLVEMIRHVLRDGIDAAR